jgi:hypothetical protein
MQTLHRFGVEGFRANGFEGFVTVDDLRGGTAAKVPSVPGVYVVFRVTTEDPTFLQESVGGRFKGKDPTVAIGILEARWIPRAELLYVGKADVLSRRIRELSEFGRGRPIGHWGGRFLWQVEGSGAFVVAWLETPDRDPREVEVELLATFREEHGGRQPFANIA